jgi:hypothetical protein
MRLISGQPCGSCGAWLGHGIVDERPLSLCLALCLLLLLVLLLYPSKAVNNYTHD